ncbi:MAG: hypothetical protein HYX32_09995 [Actinobacteria bacterium]|nr:hypothetical protein [Actinomycetota bacterium]
MRHRAALKAVVLVAAAALVAASCGRDADPGPAIPPTTLIQGNTDSYAYELACPSAVGTLTTSLTYTVTDSAEQVMPGQTVTYKIVAPLAQVKAPVTPTFESSATTFALPAGFNATSASTDPAASENFTSSAAELANGTLVYTLTGSFPIDGSPRPTPTIVVTGTVTGKPGTSITWMTPTSVNGTASVPILGSESSACSFPTAGPIGTTTIST